MKCNAKGFGDGNGETIEFFQAEVIIDNKPYNLDVQVVPVEVMPMSCIIGRNILPIAEVRADKNSVEIRKYPTSNFLASITLREG